MTEYIKGDLVQYTGHTGEASVRNTRRRKGRQAHYSAVTITSGDCGIVLNDVHLNEECRVYNIHWQNAACAIPINVMHLRKIS